MFEIKAGKNYSLHQLARQFYTKSNPVTKSGAHKKNGLEKRIFKAYKAEKDPLRKVFFKQLCTNKFKKLREIIIAEPKRLAEIARDMNRLETFGRIPKFWYTKDGKTTSTDFGEKVVELFGYKSARGSAKFIWLVEELDSFICTYCNDEHTFKIKRAAGELILHDFDHFMPKVNYPYLSLSFFNLVPSCHNCNSILKRDTVFTITDYIHPYIDDLDSFAEFDTDKPISSDLNNFSVKLNATTTDIDLERKLGNHKRVFEIEGRYDVFKHQLIRLDYLKSIYTETYKQQLMGTPPAFKDRADLIEHIGVLIDVPTTKKSASRTDRGKFKKDFAYRFNIIK